MADLITYSLVQELQRRSDLVEQFRIVLILSKMYGIEFDEERANDLLAKLPFALKAYNEILNSNFIREIPEDILIIIKNVEQLYRDLLAELHKHIKLPAQVI